MYGCRSSSSCPGTVIEIDVVGGDGGEPGERGDGEPEGGEGDTASASAFAFNLALPPSSVARSANLTSPGAPPCSSFYPYSSRETALEILTTPVPSQSHASTTSSPNVPTTSY
ncbi:hypothetical protein CC2G_012385 [Coprinopsis cinerea AmutBmut pab1-1]|nr:hypothetical protein CC2G_012385 [Coprinopsis cinerea AmutBmut pab1-1]